MTPSGVQKERMTPEDLFVLDLEGRVLSHPGLVPGSARAYKLSACAPLFMHTYKLRGSGAVLHSHGMECVLATLLCEKLRVKEFRISHQEMIKGLVGHGYHDELVIPIIENTAHEEDLADSLEKAIRAHPQANAVLVARHGIYVWGPTWGKAKTQAECLHYLFGSRPHHTTHIWQSPPSGTCGGRTQDGSGQTGAAGLEPPGPCPTPVSTAGCQDWLEAPSTSKKTAISTRPLWIARSALVTSSSTAPSLFLSGRNPYACSWNQLPRPPAKTPSRSSYPLESCSRRRAEPTPCTPSSACIVLLPRLGAGHPVLHLAAAGKIAEILAGISHAGQMWRDLVDALLEHPPDDHIRAGGLVILLDIEGTTTPITFVHDVMFPYARDNVAGYLDAHWGQEECMADVAALRAQAEQDARDGVAGLVPIPSAEGGASDEEIRAAVVANVQWQISIDRKITALKQLQGHVWRFGFHSGALKGEVYSDVPPALDRWTEDGLRVAIYSSGSREAQQLLFGHTNAGDLRSYLSCYFDTKVGHKREAASYREIVMSLGCEAREVLFVTDIYEEAVAAREAGVAATLSVRPGNKPLPADCPFPTIGSFARIKPDEAHHPLNRL
ncbi:unnamed protein product [Heterosigma akashiwo]